MNKKAMVEKIAELEERIVALEQYVNAAIEVHEDHEQTIYLPRDTDMIMDAYGM